MFRSHRFIASCFVTIAWVTTAAAANATPRSTSSNGDVVEIADLQPFTHVAYIPAGSSASSIRIESIKLVKVATIHRSVTNERYCNQPWSEPGGSMYCQRTADESPVPAYRVTYSYRGQPMASDEYGNTYFTFSVYFRPDEISPRLREMLVSGEIRRADIAEFFEVAPSRVPIQQVVIDQAKSAFCDGNYVDGNWVQTNPRCLDKIVYSRINEPSPYVSVRVDPVSYHLETAAAVRPEMK